MFTKYGPQTIDYTTTHTLPYTTKYNLTVEQFENMCEDIRTVHQQVQDLNVLEMAREALEKHQTRYPMVIGTIVAQYLREELTIDEVQDELSKLQPT